jgi:hypothetical protein
MSQTDTIKERIAYAKLWLGILIVVGIGLIATLISDSVTSPLLRAVLCFGALLPIASAGVYLHIRITRQFRTLGVL